MDTRPPPRPAFPPGQTALARPELSRWAAAIIALAVLISYQEGLKAPFVFDDQFAIVENPSIRHLADLGAVLSPPPSAAGAAGRPLVNLTLALNYAIGGLHVEGYRALNFGLHLLAALALFGLVRRTLERMGRGEDAALVALAAAGVWAVHPLLTESVMGVIQRNEILAGLCYLLTLYCFERGAEHRPASSFAKAPADEKPGRPLWLGLSFLACLFGTASKEIVVSAPLIVLLYDRTFVAGTFRAAWSRRRGYYLALAATWLPLGALILSSKHRGGTVGFGLGVTPWQYLLTQCRALSLYLKLSVWPHPLVIDYGTGVAHRLGEVAPEAAGIVLLLAITLAALRWRPAAGFLGACFFAVLAPSSSVVPLVTQPVAEHRMYLPLAALVTLAVAGLHAAAGRRSLALWPVAALLLAPLTLRRVADYREQIPLWQGALRADPRNDRAWLDLGTLASHQGRLDEARDDYRQALRIDPAQADTHFDLAAVLEQSGRTEEAIAEYREAARLDPARPNAPYYLGRALAQSGRLDEALPPLERALQLRPASAAARNTLVQAHELLGVQCAQAGRWDEARDHFQEALRLEPGDERAREALEHLGAQGRP